MRKWFKNLGRGIKILIYCLFAFIVFTASYITFPEIYYLTLNNGQNWYVDGVNGNDSNNGNSPQRPFLTIGKAITESSDGNNIYVGQGTYTEVGLDISNDYIQMYFVGNVIIAPATGKALLVSGDGCLLEGLMTIFPAVGDTGLHVTGDGYILDGIGCIGQGAGIGFCLEGSFGDAFYCKSILFQTKCFDIAGTAIVFNDCIAGGSGASSYGFYVNGGSIYGSINNCTSGNNVAGSYYLNTTVSLWTVKNSTAGSGDGPWVDVDHTNAFNNNTYDDEAIKVVTLDGSTTYNLYEIVGSVRLSDVHAVVTTQIANTASTMHIEVYSTNGSVDITDAPGTSIQADIVGTFYVRNGNSGDAIDKATPTAGPVTAENVTFNSPKTAIDVVADPGVTTYIRVVLSAGVASGVIDFHVNFKPLSDEGILIEL